MSISLCLSGPRTDTAIRMAAPGDGAIRPPIDVCPGNAYKNGLSSIASRETDFDWRKLDKSHFPTPMLLANA